MRKENLAGYLLLVPLVALIGVFYVYPIISMSRLSLYTTRFGFGDLKFSGLRNFVDLQRNPAFKPAIVNSITWTLVSAIIQLIIPIGLALMLNQQFRGVSVARSLLLIPWVTPAVVIAIMWRWILEPTMGVFNRQMLNIGLFSSRVNFLGNPKLALITLICINSLKYIPFGTLLILASLQSISKSLYEAMMVDGATAWQQLKYLIMPLINPMIGFMGFLIIVWNFNVFDLIQMTTGGGPANATITIPVLLFRTAYRTFNMGQAAALSVIVLVVMFITGGLYFTLVWTRQEEGQ